MNHDVVLHQWEISLFCQKVAKALHHKGIAFDTVNYNGALGAKVMGLSKVGKLPVLDMNGQRIQDSTRIARYLDDTYPDLPRLYPLDPQQKAIADMAVGAQLAEVVRTSDAMRPQVLSRPHIAQWLQTL